MTPFGVQFTLTLFIIVFEFLYVISGRVYKTLGYEDEDLGRSRRNMQRKNSYFIHIFCIKHSIIEVKPV